jgi:hypothetical protein
MKTWKKFARLDARRRGCVEAREHATRVGKKSAAKNVEGAYRMPGSMKK